jgi:NAD(P)-dependent dehydrogenase (short-subunit alcohol dehydrogenase family)
MHDMSGRVCVVTGASAGIGLETAVGLAARGATVCLVGRSRERTEAARERVRAESKRADVHALCADFESLASVRALAEALLEAYPRIHVLVNNAGLWIKHRQLAACGVETTVLVNHVAPFLLTQLLLPRLRDSAPARVVTVSSRLHIKERGIRYHDFHREGRFDGLGAYRQSKLANVLFANELARRLDGSGVTSNSVHPGDVATDVVRDSSLLRVGMQLIARHYLLTPEEGARTSIYAATAPELARVTGQYFAYCRAEAPSRHALDPNAATELWRVTERLAGLAS